MDGATNLKRDDGARRGRRVAALALALAALSWSVPLLPDLPDSSVDASWSQATLDAIVRGAVFGHDVVFTYGPWAWLQADAYHPGTYGLGLVWGAAIGLWLWWSLLRLRDVVEAGPWTVFAWVLLVVLSRSVHALAMCLPLLVVVASSRASRRDLYLVASGVALLMGVLAKASNGPAVALAAVALLLRDRRSGAVFAAAATVALLGLWRGSGQPLSALPGFVRGAWEFTAGYAGAMGRTGPASAVMAFVLAALCMGGWARSSLPPTSLASVVLVGAGTLFLAFKSAFVRHDVHALIGAAALVNVAVFSGMVSPWSKGLGQRAAVLVVLASAAFITLSVGSEALRPLERLNASAAQAMVLLAHGKAGLDARYAARLVELQRFHPLPASTIRALAAEPANAVDVMPHGLNAALSRGWALAPRPVLQSYAAYTPWLAAQNESHLRSSSGARALLLTGRAIDGHPLLMEDGPSWRAVLEHYEPDAADAAGVLWRRLPVPRPWVAEPARQVQVPRGSAFVVEEEACEEDCGLTFVQAEVRLSVWGRLVGLLLRPPPVQLELSMTDGTTQRRRYIPAMGQTGFVLSPLLDRAEDVAAVVRGAPGPRVRSARIVSDAAWAYQDVDAVTLTTLRSPGR